MEARLPYTRIPDGRGSFGYVVRLGVEFSLPKPHSPRTNRFGCIIDSGASSCLFHADIASLLHIDLKSGIRHLTQGIGSVEETWLHEVTLHLPGGPIRVVAGFQENLPVPGLLGMSGFFEHFKVNFDSALQQCTLQRIYRT